MMTPIETAFRDIVIDSIQDAVIILDAKGKVLFMNAAAEAFRDLYSPSVELGRALSESVRSEWKNIVASSIRSAVKDKKTSSFETSFLLNNRNTFFDVRSSPIIWTDDKVHQVLIELRDITLQKIYENKIKSVGSDLKNLIEYANALIIGLDARGYITEWNAFTAEITGHSGMEALSKHFAEILADQESVVALTEVAEQVLSGRQLSNVEVVLKTKHLKNLTILVNATPRKNPNNEIVGTMIIGQDISELASYRKSLERKVKERTEELQAALEKQKGLVEMKNRFVSIASHEFRSPISVIRLQADLIKRTLTQGNNTEVMDRLGKILEMTNHMSTLLEDVLQLGKNESDKIKINFSKVELTGFFRELVNDVAQATDNTHEIVTQFPARTVTIESDPNILRNIFVNLLTNAIKFSPGKKQVFLSIILSASAVEIVVRDCGIGICAEEIDTVFQPFTRGSNTKNIKGTGLGLSIVKRAVESMNARLWVESEINKGTTFTVQVNSINYAIERQF